MSQHAELNRGPFPSLTPLFKMRNIRGLDCILGRTVLQAEPVSLVSRSGVLLKTPRS